MYQFGFDIDHRLLNAIVHKLGVLPKFNIAFDTTCPLFQNALNPSLPCFRYRSKAVSIDLALAF